MRKLMSKLWADDGGFIITVEMMFIVVILVIGLIAGMANLRIAIVTELMQIGNAILALNPGYQIETLAGDTGGSQGSAANLITIPQLSSAVDLASKAPAVTTDVGVVLIVDLVP